MNFSVLYDRYADIVYSYLRQRLKDQYLIEDIMQETFLSIYKNLDKYKNESSLKAWILTITHHRMVDKLRKIPDYETLSVEDEDIVNLSKGEFPSDKVAIRELIDKLKADNRTIIYGLYVLELSCCELSRILNIPEGTVKSRAYYARQKMKKWLKED